MLKVLCFSVLILAFVFVATPSIYGSHGGGSGGGGGCSGDCFPPTLGLDDRGMLRVSQGLTINSESFEVKFFSQTLPTQILNVGEKVRIVLKIYENSTPEFLSHAELHFKVYDKFVEGIKLEDSTVSIVWDDTDGDVVYGVYGEENIIKNISIEQYFEEDLAVLTFEFEFTTDMDISTLMTEIWDERRNSAKNYFYQAFKVINESDSIYDMSSNEFSSIHELDSLSKTKEESTIPSWIKLNAGWWAEEKINDSNFINGLQYMIDMKIIIIPQIESNVTNNDNKIPSWIKNTAGWWAEGILSDDEFIKGIQYMITKRVISV